MSQAKAIPERSQIAPEYTWNTADLYPTDQAWQEDFSRLQAMVPKLAAYAGRLEESADTLYAYVTLEQEAGELLVKLMDYAQRRSDEDTRVPEYQAMVGKITSQYVALSQAVSFEIPEVLRIPTETLERFYGEKPELELYRRYFTIIQDRREHTLSDSEEKLLAGVGELAQAPDDIFSKLSDADLTFPDAVDGKGEQHPLSNGSYTLLMASEDRALRKSAFENLYSVYGGVKNTMAATLSAQVKQLPVLLRRPEVPQRPGRLSGLHPGAGGGLPQPDLHRPGQPGQDAPVCPPAEKAAGGGRAAHVRRVRPHGVRHRRQDPL